MRLPFAALAVVCMAFGCARAPVRSAAEAMRKVSAPRVMDDLPLEPLLAGVEEQLRFWERQGAGAAAELQFGPLKVSREVYVRGLRRFVELGRATATKDEFLARVVEEFDFHEVYGQASWGEAFITSYYEPVIPGSPTRTEKFDVPLYAKPPEILELDLSLFDPKFEGERKLRARVVEQAGAKRVLPYYSREEIDGRGALNGRGLELCWVDAIDAFFLQIQGSGTVELPGGKRLRVNYAEKNGCPYEPVGKFLKERIPQEKLNLHTIEAELRKMPRDQLQYVLNKNGSYVFFRLDEKSALTFLGVPATDGRTIATDRRYFPKGALAFLAFDRPRFDASDALVPSSVEPTARFVLDQDVGGAINGGGRVDLFWGRGDEAKKFAGVMKQAGRLYYLTLKGI